MPNVKILLLTHHLRMSECEELRPVVELGQRAA